MTDKTPEPSLADYGKKALLARWTSVFKARWTHRNALPDAEGNRVTYALEPLFDGWWDLRRTLAKPPSGWFLFGSHADESHSETELEFWGVGTDGLPLWERPVPPNPEEK